MLNGSIACAIAGFALLLAGLTGGASSGAMIFSGLFLFALYPAVVITFARIADSFSDDWTDGNLGLLFITGMKWWEVMLARVGGSALIAFYNLLAIAPAVAVLSLSGGFTLELIVAAVVALLCAFLLSLSLATLGAVIGKQDSVAGPLGGFIGAVICGVGPGVHAVNWLVSGRKLSVGWLRSSPAYGCYLLSTHGTMAPVSEIMISAGLSVAWSAVLLIISGQVLRRTWQAAVTGIRDPGIWQTFQSWLSGRANPRVAATLETNPFQWLAMRSQRNRRICWMVVSAILAGWLVALLVWREQWLTFWNLVILAVIINLVVSWFGAYTIAQAVGSGRRDGTLELLLTSPLTPEQIVDGQLSAWRTQFRPLIWTCVAVSAGLALLGLGIRPWTQQQLYSYLLAWAAILLFSSRWKHNGSARVLWTSLNSARPLYSVWIHFGGITTWIWCGYHMSRAVSVVSGFPTGNPLEIAFLLGMWLLIGFTFRFTKSDRSVRDQLIAEFREIAAEPVPNRKDPRFKKWKPNERFSTTAVE